MSPSAIHATPLRALPKRSRSMVHDWLLAFRGGTRTSRNVVRVIDEWIDEAEIFDARWIKRAHPEYEVAFSTSVRGQELRVYIDHNASSDFLGLYAYLYAFTPDVNSALFEKINRINLDSLFGVLELDPDSEVLRYRFTVDVEGIRITPKFLAFMMESAQELLGNCLMKLLPRPTFVGRSDDPPF